MPAPRHPKFSALGEAALLLQPYNFTPPQRTPWGGTRIATAYKSLPAQLIGESWEVSVEPQFPSRAETDGRPLQAWLDEAPGFFMGRRSGLSSLLVKLLDARDRLSLQIHPHGHESFLAPGESGKPESWLVLHSKPGAGIFLGFRNGVGEQDVRDALADGVEAVERLLHFEPVQRGDFFRIDAGTAHAVGEGVTLAEPQRVEPGRIGVTYRYYDWHRLYDQAGHVSLSGQPRPLHLEQAVAVTDWNGPREDELVGKVRARTRIETSGPLQHVHLLGRRGKVPSKLIEVCSIEGSGSGRLAEEASFFGLTVLSGACTLENETGRTFMHAGQSAAIPAALSATTKIEGNAVHALLCSTPQ